MNRSQELVLSAIQAGCESLGAIQRHVKAAGLDLSTAYICQLRKIVRASPPASNDPPGETVLIASSPAPEVNGAAAIKKMGRRPTPRPAANGSAGTLSPGDIDQLATIADRVGFTAVEQVLDTLARLKRT